MTKGRETYRDSFGQVPGSLKLFHIIHSDIRKSRSLLLSAYALEPSAVSSVVRTCR